MVEDIDSILKRRRMPEAPSNLAERIIDASLREDENQAGRFSIQAWLQTFFDSFLMPHPAVAMVALLLAGVVLGTFTGAHIQDESALEQQEMFSALYTEADFNAGEWL